MPVRWSLRLIKIEGYSNYGWHYSRGQGPRLNGNRKQAEHRRQSCCFLTVPHSSHPAVPSLSGRDVSSATDRQRKHTLPSAVRLTYVVTATRQVAHRHQLGNQPTIKWKITPVALRFVLSDLKNSVKLLSSEGAGEKTEYSQQAPPCVVRL